MPLARPDTVIGEADPVAVIPPGLAVAVYAVIAVPPLFAGALNITVALAFPAMAVTPVGAPGTVAGVTPFELAEAGLVPAALVAVTVKV